MNDGVKLLIARMDLNAEEFDERGHNQWEQLFNHYKKYFSEEEKKAFWDKLCEIRTKEFTAKVIEKITVEKNHNEWAKAKPDGLSKLMQQTLDDIFKEEYTKHEWKWVTDKGNK